MIKEKCSYTFDLQTTLIHFDIHCILFANEKKKKIVLRKKNLFENFYFSLIFKLIFDVFCDIYIHL